MKAFNLQRIDQEHDMHLQAWLNVQAGSTNEKGKSVFKNFKQFFDFDKRIKEIDEPKVKKITANQRHLARIAAKVNSGKEVG